MPLCPLNDHRWRVAQTMRLSKPRDGKNAVKVYECKLCGLGKTELVTVGAAKMKGKGAR